MTTRLSRELLDAEKKLLISAWQEVKDEPLCSVQEVIDWVKAHATQINEAQGRVSTKQVQFLETTSKVKFLGKGPVLVTTINGQFRRLSQDPSVLLGISGLLPDISIQEKFSRAYTFRAEMKLDLSVWKNLVPGLLNERLYQYYVDVTITAKTKTSLLTEIDILREQFYPETTLAMFEVAAAVGVIEQHPKSLHDWLSNRETLKHVSSLPVPDNMTLC